MCKSILDIRDSSNTPGFQWMINNLHFHKFIPGKTTSALNTFLALALVLQSIPLDKPKKELLYQGYDL